MDIEKYTERSKGFIQSAQNLALRSGHQRLTPEHLAKVLLEDKDGLCANLIKAAGGDPKIVLAQVDAELTRIDLASWQDELKSHDELFEKLGQRLPDALDARRGRMHERLAA